MQPVTTLISVSWLSYPKFENDFFIEPFPTLLYDQENYLEPGPKSRVVVHKSAGSFSRFSPLAFPSLPFTTPTFSSSSRFFFSLPWKAEDNREDGIFPFLELPSHKFRSIHRHVERSGRAMVRYAAV